MSAPTESALDVRRDRLPLVIVSTVALVCVLISAGLVAYILRYPPCQVEITPYPPSQPWMPGDPDPDSTFDELVPQ